MTSLQSTLLPLSVLIAGPLTAAPLGGPGLDAWRTTRASGDYTAIARAYADYMIAHGRDVYGKKHTPLFVTGMDRKTGGKISPPFAHVKRKPFMPGWERDRELRGSDRNYGNADPLDQLTLLKLMHRLTELTGDKRYATEADRTASWWMANAQSPIGLYPWGSHTSWNVDKEGGGGIFEFNHVWPYWDLNQEALQKYAMGLWDHYIRDKKTGDFNRHAHSHRHGPAAGMGFPWPGSAMIATWVQAYLAEPDPEYVRAIETVLKRWESLRDENGHLAPCSNYKEWAWYLGYVIAANRLDDWAGRIEAKEPALARKMRDYGRKCDAAYLKLADNLLDIKRVGPVKSYLRATGGYNPERLDIIGGPWQDRKDYAGFALMLHERMKHNDSPDLRKRYRKAVLDTAEIYLSVNPEVQWSVWGENVANAMQVMLSAHELTGNPAYLHRADHFARLAVDLFLDDASPLPKLTSQDDYYEIESVTEPSGDVWMLVALDVREQLARLDRKSRRPVRIPADGDLDSFANAPAPWVEAMKQAVAGNRAGVWDCARLEAPAASVALAYGENGAKSLFLSRPTKGFSSANGLPADSLALVASDHINKIPTLEEAKPFNGPYRRKFSGKYREPSTARYGGFKDVLDQAGLLLANRGAKTAKVAVATTFHDSWDDRETKKDVVTIKPGERVLVAVAAPEKRFIRRIDITSNTPGAAKLERFAFAMTPRSKLNPLSADTAQPSAGPRSSSPATAPSGPAFGNAMMNYRLQVDGDGKVGAVVRGASARQQVNRQARVNVRNRFAVITARFDPKATGTEKITITVDGHPATYSYQNAEGQLTTFTHDRPLLIGRQPGREARHFKGDLAGVLLYNRALRDEELHSTARWLSER